MARFLLRKSVRHQRKCGIILLAFIWCAGLACGIFSFRYAGNSFLSLMRMAATCPVSIVNLLIASILPFLFSAFAVYLHVPQLFAVLCFLKAWLLGFVSIGCLAAFQSAGWLVWLMVSFSDILCLVPLWWYWIYHIDGGKRMGIVHLIICFLFILCAIGLDHSFISPFLVNLIEF